MTDGHLETYDLTLTAQTPLFIGSGKEIGKQEYAYDPQKQVVKIIDMSAFMQLIADKGLAGEYENLILRGTYAGGMSEFLSQLFRAEEIAAVTLYECSVRGIGDFSSPKSSIQQFIRLPDNCPYVPGSSIKGALRTCLFTTLCTPDEELKKRFLALENERRKIDVKVTTNGDRYANDKVFNTLPIDLRPKHLRDAVNSVMKTLSVSDSEPIAMDALTLCDKRDILDDGTINKINVLRECIRPGTSIHCKLTIDRSIDGLTVNQVKEAVSSFYKFYHSKYPNYFKLPSSAFQPSGTDNLIVGGGAGFFAKTVVYNLFPHEEAKDYVDKWMNHKFPKGKHGYAYDIAPHMLKYTQYQGSYMPFGVCRFEVK